MPYFGKRSDNYAYFLHLRNERFYGVFRIGVWETEPNLGVFLPVS
jgi:hypothetical protein